MSDKGNIQIKCARVHNLKNIDVEIPRNKLVVITGLSGSGKSSLAFDTLYAEGQRRYVESLSSYARQFLGRMSKPEVDYIKGIPPAIAIEQKVNTRNPRSTVGTSTEIYEYIKLLFARIGKTYSPISGALVKKHEADDVVQAALTYPDDTRLLVLAPVVPSSDRTLKGELQNLMMQGFSRVEMNGDIVRIQEAIDNDQALALNPSISLVIDRLTVDRSQTGISRLTDSVETAFFEGRGNCILSIADTTPLSSRRGAGGEVESQNVRLSFSKSFEADGMQFEIPTVHTFSFNSPLGACPTCEGFGRVIGVDEDLVIPNKGLSIFEDAVMCWRGEVMGEYKKQLIRVADKFNFPIHKPFFELTDAQRELLWTGNQYFEGLNAFFKMLEENQYKIQYRVMLARYRGKTVCPDCKGSRLKKEASYIKVDGKSISELVLLPITELKAFFDQIQLDETDAAVAKRLLLEINSRIQFLLDVGLGYLTLNRLSNTLSGGESQRINLATSLGSSLVGSLYILDEPSIGLHSRD
nr:excinuclease ABC subunit A [Paludibacter sp.]